MTTYRVGTTGATVFDPDGTQRHYLEPGQVVVEGSTELSGSLAAQHHDNEQRRRKGYADKALHPAEDRG